MKKQAQVVMLATDKAEDCLYLQNGKLQYHKGYLTQNYLKDSLNGKSFHLYILSDDKIEEGDWCFDNNTIYKIKDKNHLLTVINFGNSKKIIATTDLNLEINNNFSYSNLLPNKDNFKFYLPQIPQQFIELFITEYNKGIVITEVEVEYEEYFENNSTNKQWVSESSGRVCNNYRLYTNKNDNTINIILSVKKMYSREEVENYISLAWATCSAITYKEGESIQKDCESWISTHLK